MKKHLTLPVPSFESMGAEVSPRVESVVRQALAKEASARTASVEEFLDELREAVLATSETMGAARETGALDANKTLLSPSTLSRLSKTGQAPQQTAPEAIADSAPGKISSPVLSAAEQAKLATSQAAYQHEQKQRDRVAREELEREASARRYAVEEKERLRKTEEDRQRKEKDDREARERQQREQMERVERTAKELEERLARLATSMPPSVGVLDPEATQVSGSIRTEAASNNSFPGARSQSTPGRTQMEIAIPNQSTSKLIMIGVAVVVVLLIVGSITGYFLLRSKPSTEVVGPANTNPANTNQGTSESTETIKADLVEIPGGNFLMGRNDGPPQEQPAHPVTVQKFFMDRTEVTNAEYADFVRDLSYEPPTHWVRGKPLAGQEKWPVVNVSQKDAEAFASWRSKRDGVTYRLPTEEEWEFAARSGGEYKSFPWGDAWAERRAVIKEANPRPVGTYPEGKNRWGVLDLIGNAWEWTSSKASVYSSVAEIPAANKDWVLIRGGSYASDPNDRQIPVSATYRDWFDPTLRHPNFGFRLVRTAE